MSDVLVRGIPEDVVRAIDARAAKLGISRNEYLHRRLVQDAATDSRAVGVEDLRDFARTFSDLGNADVMSGAWE